MDSQYQPSEFKIWKLDTSGNRTYVESKAGWDKANRRASYLQRKNFETDETLVNYYVGDNNGKEITNASVTEWLLSNPEIWSK